MTGAMNAQPMEPESGGEPRSGAPRLDKQLVLPGLPAAPPTLEPAVPATDELPPAVPADERQLALFADKVALERDIEAAVQSGAFADARRLRDLHLETYGASAATAELGFLDHLAPIDLVSDAGLALTAWEEADARLASQPLLRRRVCDGVFRCLLERHSPRALAAARPDCLGALAGFLTAQARAEGADSSPAARGLVRDALLAGRAVDATAIADDALADLFAEDLPPPWLACLGAVRRLWPVPPASEAELRAFQARGAAEGDALGFWECLRVAETPGRPEPLLHEARRRMKRLRPDLHAAYMRLARPAVS